MKKIVLSLAGVLAATAFAPEAAAIPAFARQTGMACSACHFQHFPILNGFGQAFKASGYTMMGAQGKVEGEHLSIPDTLNMSMLIKLRYQKTNGTDAPGTVSGTTTNSGQWQIPDEFSLFAGGRIAENVGFIFEGNLVGTPLAAQIKTPVVFDMGGAKLNVIPFTTDSGGPAYGFELSSGSVVRALRWSEDRNTITTARLVGLHTAATGLTFAAKNDMGYINFTRWAPAFTAPGGAVQLRSNWLRIAATPTVADWNMHIGLGLESGTSYIGGGATKVDTKNTLLDFQGQTALGGNDFSLYASYGRAPGTAAGAAVANYNNGNPNAASGFTIGADYSVINHVAHVGAAIKRSDNGKTAANKDNGLMVQGIYDLAQNLALHAIYTHNSGSAYSAPGSATNAYLFMLEGAW